METLAAGDLKRLWAVDSRGVSVGRIVYVDSNGAMLVDFPGNELGPLRARSVLDRERLGPGLPGKTQASVLLAFENADTSLPIIVGCLSETLNASRNSKTAEIVMNGERDLSVDGRRVTVEASEEIVLRCGESSIMLKKNGRIVIKGNDIVSRASRTNKLKGAAVAIN